METEKMARFPQFKRVRCDLDEPMTYWPVSISRSKRVLVTGVSAGLGVETGARLLAAPRAPM